MTLDFPLTFYNVDRSAGDGPDGRHQERVLPADDVAPRAEVAVDQDGGQLVSVLIIRLSYVMELRTPYHTLLGGAATCSELSEDSLQSLRTEMGKFLK